jgi:hypothetical protein
MMVPAHTWVKCFACRVTACALSDPLFDGIPNLES